MTQWIKLHFNPLSKTSSLELCLLPSAAVLHIFITKKKKQAKYFSGNCTRGGKRQRVSWSRTTDSVTKQGFRVACNSKVDSQSTCLSPYEIWLLRCPWQRNCTLYSADYLGTVSSQSRTENTRTYSFYPCILISIFNAYRALLWPSFTP